jgi:hypothetical protein
MTGNRPKTVSPEQVQRKNRRGRPNNRREYPRLDLILEPEVPGDSLSSHCLFHIPPRPWVVSASSQPESACSLPGCVPCSVERLTPVVRSLVFLLEMPSLLHYIC